MGLSSLARFEDRHAQHILDRLTGEAEADRLAAMVGKPARRSDRRMVLILRTRWWPRFLVAGALLIVVGMTLLSCAGHAWVAGAEAAILFRPHFEVAVDVAC
jgi:hypothetical protein